MSLDQELGIDFSQLDVGSAEKAVAAGRLVPKGLHHAVLEGVRAGTANSGTPFREFTFKIIAGPAEGATVEHTLYLPHEGQAEDKKKKSVNQLAIYAHRLGLKKKVKQGDKEVLVPIEGKHDFTDCYGAACVIDVKHEDETFTDKKTGHPRTIAKARLTFEGVLLVDDARCKDVPKAKTIPAVSAAAGQQSGGGAAGGKKEDYSDL